MSHVVLFGADRPDDIWQLVEGFARGGKPAWLQALPDEGCASLEYEETTAPLEELRVSLASRQLASLQLEHS